MAGITAAQGRKLLESAEHSDFLITCQNQEIKVHKAILASVSDFFRLLFKHDFKETTEAKVDFPDDDFDTIHRLCEFIYTGSYSVIALDSPDSEHSSMASTDDQKKDEKGAAVAGAESAKPTKRAGKQHVHALVYCCAHEYDVPVLKDKAYAHFVESTHATHFLWEADLITLVYENTDRDDLGLRSFVTRTCIDHYTKVLKDQAVCKVLNDHEPALWMLGMSLTTQNEETEKKVTHEKTRVKKLQTSLKDEESKVAELRLELAAANVKTAADLADAKEETAAAKAETAREVDLAKKMFKHVRGAMYCEHCGKGDKLAAPVRQWNEKVGKEQYLLQCDACGWWWWFNRD